MKKGWQEKLKKAFQIASLIVPNKKWKRKIKQKLDKKDV